MRVSERKKNVVGKNRRERKEKRNGVDRGKERAEEMEQGLASWSVRICLHQIAADVRRVGN